jgi:hypothetical protein
VAKRAEITAAHRQLEDEQQTALAQSCDEPAPQSAHERCLPSCYSTEPADPRAGKAVRGAVALDHLVCQPRGAAETDPFVLADEIEGTRLSVRSVRTGFPRSHRKGSWQATVEAWFANAQLLPAARGDAFVVTSPWRRVTHPLTKEHLRCVTLVHYTHALHHALEACGSPGNVTCEAAGNAAARGINVVHYRLAEAKTLQSAGRTADCQQAALEAIAVARGLPRWRQYAKLNANHWTEHSVYRTRFDGMVDEDGLFDAAAALGGQAESVYAACGGAGTASTAPEQEQSFHACW